MIKYFVWLLPCFFVLTGVCQKANFKEAERFMRSKSGDLVGSTSVNPNFLKDSDKFWYRFKRDDGTRYYFVDPKGKVHRELFDREYMAAEISKITHGPVNKQELPLNAITFKKDEKTMEFMVDTFRFEYNIYTKGLVKIDSAKKKEAKKPKKKKNLVGTYSPDSTYIVYAKSHDLYLLQVKDSVETRLTTDGELNYSYARGDSDTTVKRVTARVTWFANSERFFVRRTDRRKIKKLFVVNSLSTRPALNEYNYVMAGDENVQQEELFLFDTLTKKPVKVAVEKWKDQTVRLYTTPEKKVERLYFLRKKRTCDEIDFCRVDPVTGEVKVLFNEVSKPYFNDDFAHLSLLNDGDDIIWWSERTGHGHFYHYDGEGNLKNAITSGSWTSGKMVKIDTVGRTIYFEGYGQVKGECPYYARVNKAHIDGNGKVEMLTPEQATHEAYFSKSGRYFVDNYSRADLEPKSVLRDNKGKVIFELASADLTRLYETGWKMPEAFTVKAADGVTDLYGFMWKPFDFDSTRRYPIISYVYPGPQTEAIPLKFSVSAVYNVPLAQVGFVVVTFGHRGGSPMRDKWYHTFGYNNLRDYPLADDKRGIEQLADRYDFIDGSKVGIFGHSGGGFMSTAAICTYPDFYTAAVSSAGNHDNNIYNQWWGETHHGIKEVKTFEKKTVKDSVTGKDSTLKVEQVKFQTRIPTNIELAKNLKGI